MSPEIGLKCPECREMVVILEEKLSGDIPLCDTCHSNLELGRAVEKLTVEMANDLIENAKRLEARHGISEEARRRTMVAYEFRNLVLSLTFRDYINGAVCMWYLDDEDNDIWEGTCGCSWTIIDGTPEENDMNYCPKCGKKLVVFCK